MTRAHNFERTRTRETRARVRFLCAHVNDKNIIYLISTRGLTIASRCVWPNALTQEKQRFKEEEGRAVLKIL